MSFAALVCLKISQIARVALFLFRQAVFVGFGVIMAAGAHSVRGRAVAELMNMNGMLLPRIKSFDIRDDFYASALLSEPNRAHCFIALRRMQHGHGLSGLPRRICRPAAWSQKRRGAN